MHIRHQRHPYLLLRTNIPILQISYHSIDTSTRILQKTPWKPTPKDKCRSDAADMFPEHRKWLYCMEATRRLHVNDTCSWTSIRRKPHKATSKDIGKVPHRKKKPKKFPAARYNRSSPKSAALQFTLSTLTTSHSEPHISCHY